MKRRSTILTWVATAMALFAIVVGGLGIGIRTAHAAAGSTPPHTKLLTDNHDGTYTLSLDVVGESERKPNPVNVIVILDHSGSMDERTGGYGSQTRMAAAQNAVNNLARSLYNYNTTEFPNLVQMALVGFSTTGAVTQGPTNSYNTFSGAVNGLDADGGTNWEDALQDAAGINFNDSDPTYVIFVSDGNPTFRNTRGNYNPMDQYYYNTWGVYGNGSDSQTVAGITAATTIARCYEHAVDDAASLAATVGADHFYTIGAYGNVSRMQSLTTDAGAPAGNYFSAANTTELQNALAAILAEIEKAGIGSVEIEDGTTNRVTASSGVVELLEVDTSSFKYYKDGAAWADAPEAQFVNGAVEWDLSSVGVLDDGVKYTVTFDCYPSQYTYDTIAQLKNGDITYSSLDPEVQKYIVDNGNGTYSLRTNTTATLDWDDTRTPADEQAAEYINPDPVRTDAATMSVSKAWENTLDARKVGSIDMTVLMGTTEFHKVTLTDPEWSAENIYISPGIIKNGQVLPGAEGHDFTFAELGSEQYNWELVSPVVHPMLINGTLTMLTLVDEAHPAPSGAQTYTINGKTYYSNGTSSASLDAYNYRRSNLNLTKVVTGEDAPEDATFPFTLTVNNSKASSGSASDTNSDYYVWFSIYDTKAGATVMDATVTGATGPSSSGYYYAPSGTAITVEMKDGWNLRFTNLPTGTTYTFAEGNLDDGFAFNKAELTNGEDSTFSAGKTSTGTVENTNTSYQVVFTNDYQLTDLEITKVWDDASNQDGMRLTADELKAQLTLSPAVEGAEPTVVDNGDNTYTITYTGLPRFNNGQEVTYTVAERAIDGYTTTGSPAVDHGTITNTHEPEVIKVTVKKVWDDSNDIGGIRPDSIQAQLKANGKNSGDPVTLNEDNEWTYTWEDLPKFADGEEIEYTADETAVPAGYTKTGPVSTVVEGGSPIIFTVTNTYSPTPITAEFPVAKDLVVPDGLEGPAEWSYDITVAANNGAPAAETMTGTVDQDTTSITFGPFTYTMPGTYTYTVTESGTVDGVENDSEATTGKTVTVTVADDGTGKLTATVAPTAGITFTNTYSVDSTTAEFPVKKVLSVPEGQTGPATWSYTINVAANDGAPEADTMSGTVNQTTDTVTFGEFTYTEPGTYTYTVTESGTVAGVTNDSAASTGKTVTVTVVDNGDGTLTATPSSTANDPTTFTNTYEVGEVTASIPVEKILTVPDGLTGPAEWSYTITAEAVDGAPVAESMTVTVTKTNPSASIGLIKFTEPGEYTYTVTETGTVDGVTNDPEPTKTIKIVVTDNGDGTLTAVVNGGDAVQFTNTYSVDPTTAEFPVKKVLSVPEGLTGPTTWSYTIDVEANDGAPEAEAMTGTVSNTADTVTFGDFTYTEPGTYTYTVTETGEVDGVTNDSAATTGKIVTVTVVDNGDGTLTATADATEDEPLQFTNTYSVEPTTAEFPVEKVMSVPEGLNGPTQWSYTIDVAANDDAPEAEAMTGTVDQDNDTVTFGDFTYTEPGTYTYTVTETGEVDGVTNDSAATTGKIVTVTVVDNGDGTLTATADATEDEPLQFTNTYSVEPTTAEFPVEKVISVPEGVDGPSEWEYTITVTAEDDAPEAETMTGTVDQDTTSVTFGAFEFTEPGTYTYTVTETGEVDGVTNDPSTGKTVRIQVVDNGDGTLTATVSPEAGVTFTNTYAAEGTVVLRATKVADGFDLEAGQFSFELKDADGEVLQTKQNDADGIVTFEAIEYTAAGEYLYTINEVVVEGDGIADDTHVCDVTVTVVDNGNGTLTATAEYSDNVFVNTHGDTEKDVVSAKDTEISVDGELVEAGDTLTYTITYVNNTAGEATVTVTDTIPTNTTYVDGSADKGGVYADGTITWTIENVPAGETGTVTFQVTVNEAAAGTTIENTGTVDDGENESSTNSVTTSVPVKDVKEDGASVDGEGVQVGDTLTYEVSFTLTEDATSVVVTDDVPEHTTLVEGSIDNGGTVADGKITWDLGALEAGTYTVSFQVTVDESAVTVDAITNTASISVNNHSEVNTNTVTTTPEIGGLTISKTVEVPEGFEIDEDAEFTFTVNLTDQNGDALELAYDYEGDYEGTISNGGTITLKHGESITIKGLPALARYEITETPEDGYTPEAATISGTISADETASATAAFVNVYATDPATVTIPATKVLVIPEGLTGPTDASWTVSIAADSEGAPMPETTSYTVAPDETVSFGDISYVKPGEYQYTVTESGKVPGVTNGQTSYTVKVTVTDNGDGTLTATADYDAENPVTFTNTYSVVPTTASFEVSKDLTGTPLTAGAFEFTLTGADGAPMPENTAATNDASGKVVFDTITYDAPGTYEYTISETNGGVGGYTYDENTVAVKVVVTDNGAGELVAEVSYDGSTTFVNTYEASGEFTPTAQKVVKGHKLEDGQFTFQLLDEDGKVIETVTNNASGAVQFSAIEYDQTIFDSDSTEADESEDESGAGTNTAKPETEADAEATDEAAEAEDAQAEATEAEATEAEATEAETVESEAAEATEPEATEPEAAEAEAAEAEATEAEGDSEQGGIFASLRGLFAPTNAFAEEAEEEAAESRSKTFTYTIVEVDDGQSGYTYDTHELVYTVTVTDNGEGDLVVDYTTEGDATFTNTYEAYGATGEGDLCGTKTVTTDTDKVLEAGQFSFQLIDSDGNVIETVTNDADGNFAFSALSYVKNADKDETGTHNYTIVEVNDGQTGYTYDSHICDVTVTVTDNNDGTLTVTVELSDGGEATFDNPYDPLDVSKGLKAKKELTGKTLSAGEFTFELKDQDGKVVSTVTNAADGTVDFGLITFDKEGTYVYTATEVKGSDPNMTYDTSTKTYTVTVKDEGGQLVAEVECKDYTFKNSYKKPELPNTGDPMAEVGILPITALGTAMLLTGVSLRLRRKEQR